MCIRHSVKCELIQGDTILAPNHSESDMSLLCNTTQGSQRSRLFRLLQNGLDHLVTQPRGLRESRRKIILDMFKFLTIAVEVAETDTRTPILFHEIPLDYAVLSKKEHTKRKNYTYSSGECEFKVIGSKSVVFNRGLDNFFKQFFVAEEVLCDTKPHAEQLESAISTGRNSLGKLRTLTGVEQII